MVINCLKCTNSACCRLEVTVDRSEYNRLMTLGLKKSMTTRTSTFINKYPEYKKHFLVFDEMYKENFAIINKKSNGNCTLLTKEKKCSIYEDRPTICREYEQNRCKNIRQIQ